MIARATTRTFSLLLPRTDPITAHALLSRASSPLPPTTRSRRPLSSASPYPLYYELISYRPPCRPRHRGTPAAYRQSQQAEGGGGGGSEDGQETDGEQTAPAVLDKSKRKYYRKRAKRMYGEADSEGDDGAARGQSEFVELEPEVVDFPRLHAREEELYFYDAFAFPWEKEKHYRMVYQLERKYFPDQCLDKAFVDSGQEPAPERKAEEENERGRRRSGGGKRDGEKRDERSLIFFEAQGELQADKKRAAGGDISEKKVEEFFKCLKKVPGGVGDGNSAVAATGEPFLASRRTGLPLKWDGPSGTVLLVDKPKGWTSFTVCGKLRRLVKAQKVGHAGTLDPMAIGLLIVCVGKATKLVERYQGMVKGYSGVFRLGEATSTLDADSPVIQREPWEHIKDGDIKKAAASFCGEIWQVPPMFSAIKKEKIVKEWIQSINSFYETTLEEKDIQFSLKIPLCCVVGGEKMYEKARRGETVELSPRRVSIFQFDIERSLEDRQNLIFRVSCSKGTYIRSLCADLGKALGSCAHLTALRRDFIGQFSVDDAWDYQELQEQITKNYF